MPLSPLNDEEPVFARVSCATDAFQAILQVLRLTPIFRHESAMKRQQALDLLQRSRDELRERFGVTRLALFGSVARDSASDSSDVDILVGFDGPATSKRYFGVQFFLEDLMGCSIDLVTDKALRPELRPYVERSLIDV